MNKHCENCEKVHREHFIGCQGARLFLLKYVTISTVATANVTLVTISTVTIWVFEINTIWFFEFCHKERQTNGQTTRLLELLGAAKNMVLQFESACSTNRLNNYIYDVFILYVWPEHTASYAGLLLAPAEGSGPF